MPAQATFVLSTGRCGTQWLAEVLDGAYGDAVTVAHEPIHDAYDPRRGRGRDGFSEAAEAVRNHLQYVESVIAEQAYVETGFPCWARIPHLADRFGDRMQVIHLTRHPVPTALSWVKRGAYRPPLLPHETERVLFAPTDPGARFPEVQDQWADLSPFEKALYFWAEVHAFALEVEADFTVDTTTEDVESGPDPSPASRWLRVAAEDLFDGPGLHRVRRFLGLPERDDLHEWLDHRVDRFPAGLTGPVDTSVAAEHACVVEVAERLGYEVG